VTVNSDFKIQEYPNLSQDINTFLTELGNAELHGYILDRENFCEGLYEESQDYSGNNLIFLIDNESNKYHILGIGCKYWWIPPGLTPWQYDGVPNKEEQDEIDLIVALYKKNYPSNSIWMAKAKAYYLVCFSSPVHWAFTGLGFFCDFCDLVDAGLYLLEGNHTEAAISTVAAIPIVGSVGKVGIKVVSAAGKKAVLVFHKHGMRYFGKSGQLATIIGKQYGKSAHHIIPWQLFDEFKDPAIQKLVEKGFHPNQAENGMHLLNKINGKNWAGEVVESTFHGNHPAYTEFVRKQLTKINQKHNGDATNILNDVTSELIPDLKVYSQLAEKAIKSDPAWAGKTMNDYFIFLNNKINP
jgi:hypothetical protein